MEDGGFDSRHSKFDTRSSTPDIRAAVLAE